MDPIQIVYVPVGVLKRVKEESTVTDVEIVVVFNTCVVETNLVLNYGNLAFLYTVHFG